ncbi:hypothetical protein JXM83_03220 [Candidatus Woesearchaeota archaeon]|nr:hypothetical protein [Candidatus Woesearchaeota archaeon]
MAKILSLQTKEDKYVYEIEMSDDEARQVKTTINDLVVFSENDFSAKTEICKRGKEGRTKYFLIPKNLRKRIKLQDKKIICQRLDVRNKTFFIYAVDKEYNYNSLN